MKEPPSTNRLPKKGNGFSWGRSVRDGVVIWRLFRRDQNGTLHWKQMVYIRNNCARLQMANELNKARHTLRDQVDEIDLAIMGITA